MYKLRHFVTGSYLLCVIGAGAAQAADPSYEVQLGSLQIRDTRSGHEDTVYASIRVLVNGQDRGHANWDGTPKRDRNNGLLELHNAGGKDVSVDTGPIKDKDTVTVIFAIANIGHAVGADVLDTGINALTSVACDSPEMGVSVVACAAGAVTAPIVDLLTANCDGVIAGDTWKLACTEMRQKSRAPNVKTYFDISKDYYGKDTPHGCGHNSNYRVDVHFHPH